MGHGDNAQCEHSDRTKDPKEENVPHALSASYQVSLLDH